MFETATLPTHIGSKAVRVSADAWRPSAYP